MDRARALPRSSEGPVRPRRPAASSTRDRPADRSSATQAIQEASCYFASAERVPSKTLRRREHAHRAARVWGQWARTQNPREIPRIRRGQVYIIRTQPDCDIWTTKRRAKGADRSPSFKGGGEQNRGRGTQALHGQGPTREGTRIR